MTNTAQVLPTVSKTPSATDVAAGRMTGGEIAAFVFTGVLVGGGSKQISLQPVSVEGSTGLNVAGGLAEGELKYVK